MINKPYDCDEGYGMKSSFYGIIVTFLIFSCTSAAAPEPAIVQGPGLWTINTVFTPIQSIVLKQGTDNKPVRFWYTIVTLTNNSKQDVDFYPKCELVTDTFQIIPAGKGVGSMVFEEIKKRHKSKYPFLELLGKTDNKILQGEDNTKDIAIIWQDFDHDAKNIDVFIAGLSNETAVIEKPDTADQNKEAEKVYLRKTLKLKYNIKGNPASSKGASLEYKNKSWVMR